MKPQPNILIRRFKREDFEAILGMTESCWRGASFNQRIEELFGLRGKPWWELKRDSIKGFLERHPDWVFVAEVDGKVVGYATYSLDRTQRVGHVLNNAVHPDWRRKGIGRALHRRVLEELKREGMEVALLVTAVHNVPARRIYESHGFEVVWEALYYAKRLRPSPNSSSR
ncbi:MAG: hypothetical protein AYL32_013070 [Candidatus Bathyarchaeota archaeon B26-2]|nr:MAG: hypothetical protein AYL32_013070 [Candidatus Bathyarchaeota archaeon B26-2]